MLPRVIFRARACKTRVRRKLATSMGLQGRKEKCGLCVLGGAENRVCDLQGDEAYFGRQGAKRGCLLAFAEALLALKGHANGTSLLQTCSK
jgi:hypothetical protein